MGITAVAARIGLKYLSVLRWRSNGRLPHPDFVTAKGRELWLAGTIEAWLETADLETCPDCGARCLSVARHATMAHQARSPSGPTGALMAEPAIDWSKA